ncbi:hypothetical protein ACFLVP_04605 [Chloroflexota bacterium]
MLEDRHIKHLLSRIKCGICGQRYNNAVIEFIGSFDEFSYFQITCEVCNSQAFVTAIIQKDEGKTSEVITDLTVEELNKSAIRNPVSADDMLDIMNYLKDFDGNFSEIFSS